MVEMLYGSGIGQATAIVRKPSYARSAGFRDAANSPFFSQIDLIVTRENRNSPLHAGTLEEVQNLSVKYFAILIVAYLSILHFGFTGKRGV